MGIEKDVGAEFFVVEHHARSSCRLLRRNHREGMRLTAECAKTTRTGLREAPTPPLRGEGTPLGWFALALWAALCSLSIFVFVRVGRRQKKEAEQLFPSLPLPVYAIHHAQRRQP